MQDTKTWQHENLRVVQGYVQGSAYQDLPSGHSVRISVCSYEYDRQGETRMNHVPIISIEDETGSIVSEPHARDSSNPHQAIQNAKRYGKDVIENPQRYI